MRSHQIYTSRSVQKGVLPFTLSKPQSLDHQLLSKVDLGLIYYYEKTRENPILNLPKTYIFYSETWKESIDYNLKMRRKFSGAKLIEQNSLRPKTIE